MAAEVTTLVNGGTHGIATDASNNKSFVADPNRRYWIGHSGLDVSNAAATGTVVVSTQPAASLPTMTDLSVDAKKFHLSASLPVVAVGPGVSLITFRSMSGAPIVIVSSGESDFGKH